MSTYHFLVRTLPSLLLFFLFFYHHWNIKEPLGLMCFSIQYYVDWCIQRRFSEKFTSSSKSFILNNTPQFLLKDGKWNTKMPLPTFWVVSFLPTDEEMTFFPTGMKKSIYFIWIFFSLWNACSYAFLMYVSTKMCNMKVNKIQVLSSSPTYTFKQHFSLTKKKKF